MASFLLPSDVVIETLLYFPVAFLDSEKPGNIPQIPKGVRMQFPRHLMRKGDNDLLLILKLITADSNTANNVYVINFK